MTTVAYTDGACLGNPGPGGWGWAIPGGGYASGCEAQSTNQRMEVRAAYEAILACRGPIHIVSDSTYVVKCFNDGWYAGWLKRGWKNASKKPIANQDLWRPFIDLYLERQREITFEWVKGHSGDEMNDVADRLATEAARTQQPTSGDSPPTDLGEPDEPYSAPPTQPVSTQSVSTEPVSTEPAATAGFVGHRLAVFGYRPPDLGGYDPTNSIASHVRAEMAAIIAGLSAVHEDLVLVSGFGLGSEQLAVEAAVATEVPVVAALAFPNPEKVWPKVSADRYRGLLAHARNVITLDDTAPATPAMAGRAAYKRDQWLAGQVEAAIVVCRDSDTTYGQIIATLERRDANIYLIRPQS